MTGHDELPTPKEPVRVARALVHGRFHDGHERLLLRRWRGGWWRWRGSHWAEVETPEVHEVAYDFTADAWYWDVTGKEPVLKPWAPTRYKIADLLDALGALTLCNAEGMPAWLDVGTRWHATQSIDTRGLEDRPPAAELVACANGLLHVARGS